MPWSTSPRLTATRRELRRLRGPLRRAHPRHRGRSGLLHPAPHTFFSPLHRNRLHVIWQVTSLRQGIQRFGDNAFTYNGHLISETLPQRLRDLLLPPIGASEAEKAAAQECWNEVDGGYTRVFGLTRIGTLLAFPVAGSNHRRLEAYGRANDLDDPNGDAALARATAIDSSEPEPSAVHTDATPGTDPPA
jgi:hypothetical protein